MNRIILKPGEDDRIKAGHPWVFDNEIASVVSLPEGVLEPGGLADVESSRKEYLGRAFVNPNSKIRARLFSPSKEGVDRGFFKRRLRESTERRRHDFDLETESCRIAFAEADFLPGLVVDRFVGWPLADVGELPDATALKARLGPPRSWLSVQFLTYGMDQRREDILGALEETLAFPDPVTGRSLGIPSGVVERDEAHVRELEGLPLRTEILSGAYPEGGILIFENGLPFAVDLIGGQKTGHFLDQKANRAAAASYAQGRRVLDACCNTGGFGIHAARAGATSVVCVDSSAHALAAVTRNAVLNGVADRVASVEGNVFDLLRSYERAKEHFGLIVLDPPAFAKSRSALEGAIRGYKEINLRSMNLLDRGGVLVTCSCSYAMDEARFKSIVADASRDAGRRLRLLESRYQSSDHPILIGYDESLYLKCNIYEVM
ncbi:MAG: class I SAM-dependent rRNA methyltransferase [Treponemataceae bacterium]